jgi:hypothetical protein
MLYVAVFPHSCQHDSNTTHTSTKKKPHIIKKLFLFIRHKKPLCRMGKNRNVAHTPPCPHKKNPTPAVVHRQRLQADG